jgi:hypothetical protein
MMAPLLMSNLLHSACRQTVSTGYKQVESASARADFFVPQPSRRRRQLVDIYRTELTAQGIQER